MSKRLLEVQWNPDYTTLKLGKREVALLISLVSRGLDSAAWMGEDQAEEDALGFYLQEILEESDPVLKNREQQWFDDFLTKTGARNNPNRVKTNG